MTRLVLFLASMIGSTLAFVAVSLISFPSPLERLQGAQFVDVFQHSAGRQSWTGGMAQSEDLLIMAQRIMGAGSEVVETVIGAGYRFRGFE